MTIDRKPSRFHPAHTAFLSEVRSGNLDSIKGFFITKEKENDDGSNNSDDEDDPKQQREEEEGGGSACGGGGGGGRVCALLTAQNEAGETALYVASQSNHLELLKFIAGFCDEDTALIKSNYGIDALHIAAKKGHTGIVKELLNYWPVLARSTDPSNTCALYFAAVQDHLDIVNVILDVDEGCAKIVRKNGKTALHMAARRGFLRIVRALLYRDRSLVSVKDKKGQTALHMAVKGRDTDIVEELLNVDGLILNERDKKGNTALHIATRKWRSEVVDFLLTFNHIEVNAINNLKETALDLAAKLPYSEDALSIKRSLTKAGARHARNVGQLDEALELKKTVSYIRDELRTQLIQDAKTNKRVTGIAKELRKLQREAVNNTTNSVTVVAVLVASIAFVALFNLPGQYVSTGPHAGEAIIAGEMGFNMFCLLNSIALFISLAVVVVQVTLVAWETNAQRQLLSVMNKLMWLACLSTCGAFLSIAFVVAELWMAITITLIAGPTIIGTLAWMIYLVIRQKFDDDSQRRIKRTSGSKSFSWSLYSVVSDQEAYDSDYYKIYVV